ncbi:aldehyde ferredoxin oxidoreductase family protein [Chloroflexota bacterium]
MSVRLLRVDLSKKSYNVEEIPDEIIRQYLGGRGLGAYLLYNSITAGVEPLSKENHLIFTAGPGNGTGLFYGSKSVVTTKSPLTGIYLFSISSGMFCHQLKRAGFWALDVTGISDTPVYLAVEDGKVTFHDATSLWGMETAKAQETMMGDLPRNQAATVAIGSSGEKLYRYASIMADGDTYRAFGRGGAGAVMGSKRLKGIIAISKSKTEAVDKDKFSTAQKQIVANVKANKKWVEMRQNYGTGADNIMLSELGILPTRNWSGGQFEGAEKICPTTNETEWPRQNISCAPYCPAPCSHFIEIKQGPYKGAHCDGPEYEAMYSFGSNCGVDKFDAVVAAGQICDEHGLDVMSAGITIGFAMECFEKGLIGLEETDGIELRFGNDAAMIAMLKKIISGEGFGIKLAEGVRRLAQEIPDSEAFAMHAKGMELGGYECRGLMGQALQFAIDNRGGCHHGYGLPARTEASDGTRLEVKGKGEYVKKHAIARIVRDSIPICSFSAKVVNDALLADMISALLGETWTIEDFREVGTRIMCQERLFNMREGITRKDDTLPARLREEPKPDGPTKGTVVPLEELKDEYYQAMGWDMATGNPSDAVLAELGIKK